MKNLRFWTKMNCKIKTLKNEKNNAIIEMNEEDKELPIQMD